MTGLGKSRAWPHDPSIFDAILARLPIRFVLKAVLEKWLGKSNGRNPLSTSLYRRAVRWPCDRRSGGRVSTYGNAATSCATCCRTFEARPQSPAPRTMRQHLRIESSLPNGRRRPAHRPPGIPLHRVRGSGSRSETALRPVSTAPHDRTGQLIVPLAAQVRPLDARPGRLSAQEPIVALANTRQGSRCHSSAAPPGASARQITVSCSV
jgi:hypothetical protein